MLDLKQVEAVFTIIWPQQDWNGGDEGFCRAVAEKVVRTLQAAGLEQAVAVKLLEWGEYHALGQSTKLIAHDAFGNEFARLDNPISKSANEIAAFKAERQITYEKTIRSALVATPPAEAKAQFLPCEDGEFNDDEFEDELTPAELARIDAAWETHKAAVPVAVVIDDNQPGRTAIIEIITDPPTLVVGSKLYAEPKAVTVSATPPAEAREARLSEALREIIPLAGAGVLDSHDPRILRTRAALSGSGSGWREITEDDQPPFDTDVIMGCWETFPKPRWTTEIGHYGSKRGGWIHGRMTHWLPLDRLPAAPTATGGL